MDAHEAFLTVKLDLTDPVEIHDFAAHFAGIGAEFEVYLQKQRPDLKGSAKIYIKEVRKGSIVAELITGAGELIGVMDSALVIGGFASLFSKRVRNFVSGGFLEGASKSDLKNIHDSIEAVSSDRDGTLELYETHFENGQPVTTTALRITADEARKAQRTIERQKDELDGVSHADHSRVLMVFERPSKSSKTVGQSTGERVLIEEISAKPKALVYGSDLAEQRIKSEIIHSDDNIFKIGFIVDVNAKLRGGKTVAYSVTAVHQVIDLDDD
jgi:hypothetical protein